MIKKKKTSASVKQQNNQKIQIAVHQISLNSSCAAFPVKRQTIMTFRPVLFTTALQTQLMNGVNPRFLRMTK